MVWHCEQWCQKQLHQCLWKLTSPMYLRPYGQVRWRTVWTKPVNRFPVTSPAMIIAITKRKESSKTKLSNWRKALSLPQLVNFTWNSNSRTLAQGTVGLQILENKQNGDQKAEAFESNTAKLPNLDMSHLPETVVIRRRSRAEISYSYICMRYAKICQILVSGCFQDGRCRSR